ncbi:response regulator transcription factor [Salinispirillum marinum]|uniref:Response regulator transcription factor n=2 Tax=Saccharospirillaceae TaxID=255527 RepID=A0ABV8BGA0_9GAMM
MTTKKTIIIVDDNPEALEFIRGYLGEFEFRVFAATDGAGAWDLIHQHGIDLLLVDLRLQQENGLDLAREVLKKYPVPVIMISAVSDDVEKVLGLETVLNDYIEKPVVPRVLLAKIRAIMRSTYLAPLADDVTVESGSIHEQVSFGDFTLDLVERQLLKNECGPIELTNTEFRLLELLVTHPNEVFSRQGILESLGLESSNHMMRNIDVLVLRLRRKIEHKPSTPMYLQTRRNKGYVFCLE